MDERLKRFRERLKDLEIAAIRFGECAYTNDAYVASYKRAMTEASADLLILFGEALHPSASDE